MAIVLNATFQRRCGTMGPWMRKPCRMASISKDAISRSPLISQECVTSYLVISALITRREELQLASSRARIEIGGRVRAMALMTIFRHSASVSRMSAPLIGPLK